MEDLLKEYKENFHALIAANELVNKLDDENHELFEQITEGRERGECVRCRFPEGYKLDEFYCWPCFDDTIRPTPGSPCFNCRKATKCLSGNSLYCQKCHDKNVKDMYPTIEDLETQLDASEQKRMVLEIAIDDFKKELTKWDPNNELLKYTY